ncbi:MAG: phage portal protein [Atopobiaceae bacterium]|nr:phage portal protein [Atopobiaceae bacterium]
MVTLPGQIAAAQGLRDGDRRMVHDLINVWHVKRPGNLHRHEYYLMHNRLKDLGISIPPSLRNLDAACGWGKKCVDVMVEHSKFDGFTVDDPEVQERLDALVRREKLRVKYRKATTSALEQCFNLYFVSQTEKGLARVSAYPAAVSSAILDDATDELAAAMFVVSMRKREGVPTDEPDWVNVVTAEHLIRLRLIEGVWYAEYVEHGLGHIPVFMAAHEATLDRPFGASRITREVIGYIDEAVRSNINESIAAAFAASTQKYLMGTDHDPFEGRSTWSAFLGSIFNVDYNSSDGVTPQFGQLAQPSMQPLSDHFRNLCGRMAAATGIHVSQFGQVHDNPASSDAIYAENEPLILKVKDWNEDVSDTLTDVAIACLATETGRTFEEVRDSGLIIDPRFRNPAMPTMAQQTDAVVKIASVVPEFAQTETFWEMNGFNAEERKRIKRELRDAEGSSILTTIGDLIGEADEDLEDLG